jgi:predicted MFS family arabinose efflux permease
VPSPLTRLFIDGGFFAAHPTALAFFVDSLTFFVSATFFYRMHLLSPKDHLDMELAPKFVESLTFAWRHPFTRSLMLGVAVGCIGGGSLYAVGIGYVKEVLGARSDAAFGLLMALFGLGMIAGVAALQLLVHREEKPWMLRVALLVLGGIMVGMSFVHVAVMAYILAGFFGAAFGILFVVAVTMMQESVEDADRGKAFAAFHAVSRIFLVVGAGLAGGIAAVVGVHTVKVLGISYTVYGFSVALFVAGIMIASVSLAPFDGKQERVRDYFARSKQPEA